MKRTPSEYVKHALAFRLVAGSAMHTRCGILVAPGKIAHTSGEVTCRRCRKIVTLDTEVES